MTAYADSESRATAAQLAILDELTANDFDWRGYHIREDGYMVVRVMADDESRMMTWVYSPEGR